MHARTAVIALAAATMLPGCLLGDLEMQSFDSCTEYAAYMKRAELGGDVDLAVSGFDFDFGDVMIADLDDSGSRATVGPDIGGGATSWTQTNLQEKGVDEADLVKTDGEFVYAISGGKLVVTTAWPVEEATQVATLPVDGMARGLYLYDATVVVISTLEPGEDPEAHSGFSAEEGEAGWRDAPAVAVTVFDLGDMRNIEVMRETYTTGELRETRRIGDALFVVTTEDVGKGAVDPPADDVGGYFSANALKWLSVRFDNVATADGDWETSSEPACKCQDVYAPGNGAETIVTSVLKLDLADPTSEFKGTGIVGPAGLVYTSPTSLYLASTAEPSSDPLEEFESGSLRTDLHKFDLETNKPTYVASTSVRGAVPDRFGLSEHDGVLRIATWETDVQTSGITTLTTEDGAFVELDHEGGLAPGETMTAARFIDDRGFLVTYVERKDPLFAIDLSDPTDIRIGGDLEISGWSDYLHPMAERGKLLAVGTDFTFWGDPVLTVSIFDVSDADWPRLHDRYQLDAEISEASADHHAFTYDRATGFLTIPSKTGSQAARLEVLKATADRGIKYKGQLLQPAYGGAEVKQCRDIRRSIQMDGMVWAYSAAGLTAAPLSDPSTAVRKLGFEGTDPCEAQIAWDDDRQYDVP